MWCLGGIVLKPSWTEVASLALLLGFGAVLAVGWPWDRANSWPAASAIATFLAVVVSLYYSQKSARSDRAAEVAIGRMVAARISISVRALLAEVAKADTDIKTVRDNYFSDQAIALESLNRLEDCIGDFFEIPNSEMVALSKVDSDLAESISLSLGCIERLRDKNLWQPRDENLLLPTERIRLIGTYILTSRHYLLETQRICGGMRTIKLKTSKQWREWPPSQPS